MKTGIAAQGCGPESESPEPTKTKDWRQYVIAVPK